MTARRLRRCLRVALVTAAAGVTAGALGGCGLDVQLADLFLLTRTGPGQKLTLLVNDGGTISCNGGKQRTLSSSMLIAARDLSDNLAGDATDKLRIPTAPGDVYYYTMKLNQGTIAFPDRAAATHKLLARAVLFAVQAQSRYC